MRRGFVDSRHHLPRNTKRRDSASLLQLQPKAAQHHNIEPAKRQRDLFATKMNVSNVEAENIARVKRATAHDSIRPEMTIIFNWNFCRYTYSRVSISSSRDGLNTKNLQQRPTRTSIHKKCVPCSGGFKLPRRSNHQNGLARSGKEQIPIRIDLPDASPTA